MPFDAAALITPGEQQSFNIGYLFLQRIWYQLKLDLICSAVRKKYKLPFDLNGILSRCVFRQILFPSSALSTARFTKDCKCNNKRTFSAVIPLTGCLLLVNVHCSWPPLKATAMPAWDSGRSRKIPFFRSSTGTPVVAGAQTVGAAYTKIRRVRVLDENGIRRISILHCQHPMHVF